jgi:hypothetical protein
MTDRSTIDLIPYCNLPGKGWTFPDDQVIEFYSQMVKDGTFETVFCDGSIQSAFDFLDHMKDPRGQLFLVVSGHKPVAIIWLNDFQARWCQFHFCVFSHAWGDGIEEIGQYVIRQIMTMKTNDGSRYLHDMILGIVPQWNERAIEYVKEVGGKIMCRLPYACLDGKTGESIPGVLFCATREILGVEE